MRIPSKSQCFELMCAMGMLDHIVAHSLMVCRVALLMTDEMIRHGAAVHRDLVAASAMLHDITKTRSFDTGENHAETGDRFLCDRGFPEIGEIVGQHVRLQSYCETSSPTAAEIVNYADKRVLHDKTVSLESRMRYILERYGKNPDLKEKLQWLWRKTDRLEAKLFAHISFAPDDLVGRVDYHRFDTDLADYQRRCRDNGHRRMP